MFFNFPAKLITILGTASLLLCHDYEGQKKKKQVDSMKAYQNIRFFFNRQRSVGYRRCRENAALA